MKCENTYVEDAKYWIRMTVKVSIRTHLTTILASLELMKELMKATLIDIFAKEGTEAESVVT